MSNQKLQKLYAFTYVNEAGDEIHVENDGSIIRIISALGHGQPQHSMFELPKWLHVCKSESNNWLNAPNGPGIWLNNMSQEVYQFTEFTKTDTSYIYTVRVGWDNVFSKVREHREFHDQFPGQWLLLHIEWPEAISSIMYRGAMIHMGKDDNNSTYWAEVSSQSQTYKISGEHTQHAAYMQIRRYIDKWIMGE